MVCHSGGFISTGVDACSSMVYRAVERIGYYGITSLQKINQINKREDLDFAAFQIHLHLREDSQETR